MIKFKDVTFIIPVRIESLDRQFNFLRVMQYLCNTLETNIIIKECDVSSKCELLLKKVFTNNSIITYLFEKSDNPIFHRTRFLNEMLSQVSTPCVVNYDADVMLQPEAYVAARDAILKDGYDLVYPFMKGDGQIQINFPNKENYNGEDLFDPKYHSSWSSVAGHCQFFNTKSYIEGFAENLNFQSYGAEDRERMERFNTLGYKVTWLPFKVYHIEHSRGVNSSPSNPHFHSNEKLYYDLIKLSKEELIDYYQKQDYLKIFKK